MLLRYGMFSLCIDGNISSAATRCLVRSILGPKPSIHCLGVDKRLSHQLSRSSKAPLSFVEEIQELRRTAGKPFSAEKLTDSQAFKFPEMRATNLEGVDITLPSFFQKRVTLIAISMRQIGAEKLSSWISPLAVRTCSSSRAKNHTKIVQLSIVENPVARLFQSWFLSNLRRLETDPLLHHTTILRIGDSTDQRRVLGMSNRLVGKHSWDYRSFIAFLIAGYVFLVDHVGRVRFRACGEATEDELALLFDKTVELVADREKASHSK